MFKVYIMYTLLAVASAEFLLEIGFRKKLQLAARTQFPVQLIHKN